jgi:hypothetical protein
MRQLARLLHRFPLNPLTDIGRASVEMRGKIEVTRQPDGQCKCGRIERKSAVNGRDCSDINGESSGNL